MEQYSGKFLVGQGADPAIYGDNGLIIPKKAQHYAISAPVSGLEDLSGKDFALSYQVKLDDGMTCGGAYVKMPTTGFSGSEKFDNSVHYSVMFGPDKCGSTEKVHFILQSLNPVSKEMVEHHLKNPPALATSYDKHHHLYAVYVKSDGTFQVVIDGETKREGKLSEEFEPPIQPPQEIDDADDKKPDDWVDEKKIEDPNATKPDDWDEDAPEEIPDMDAVKPEDWLEDEVEKIVDPKAEKPQEWNDEEDGEWPAPMIANPKCAEAAGCGEWKRPTKANPDFKGKWIAPEIDNPAYVGEWKPKKIANPNYYEVTEPKLLPMHALGLEIWTMDQGVLFDDFYVGTDIEAAKKSAMNAFEPKKKAGQEKDKIEQKKADEEAKKAEKAKEGKGALKFAKRFVASLSGLIDSLETKLSFLEEIVVKMGLEGALDKLIDVGVTKPMTLVVMAPLALVSLFLILLAGGKKQPRVAKEDTKKTDGITKDDKKVALDEKEDGEEDVVESEDSATEKSTARRRRAKVE